jgi:hypothetical protein
MLTKAANLGIALAHMIKRETLHIGAGPRLVVPKIEHETGCDRAKAKIARDQSHLGNGIVR